MLYLTDLLLTLIVGTMVLMAQVSETQKAADKTRSKAAAQHLMQIQAAINLCINQGVINDATPQSDIFKKLTDDPSPDNLRCLDKDVSQKNPLGFNYAFKIEPVGCKPDTCTGFVYSATPILDFDSKPRIDMLAKIVSTIGIDGGFSHVGEGGIITGYSNSFQKPNPAGNVESTIAIRIGADSGLNPLLSQFYKLDGSRKLTGNMNANNNSINNVNNLNTKTITFNQTSGIGTPGQSCSVDKAVAQNSNGNGLVICNGSIWQRVGDATTNISTGQPCNDKGLTGSNAVGIGFICNGAIWVENKTFGVAGDSCTTPGQGAQNTASNEQLICRNVNGNNIYVKLGNLLAKNIEIARLIVRDGTSVPKPVCEPGGVPAFSMQMMQSVVDVANIPPRQAMYQTAVDSGSSWTVQIRLTDNNGGNFSGNTYNISSIFKTECSY